MDPITIGLAAASVAGGFMKARAAGKAAAAQAAQDEYNAKLADAAASDAISRGEVNEGTVRRRTTEAVSADEAQISSSGVDVQSGSAVDALAGQRARGELAALVVRNNAAREAWGLQGTAASFRAKGAYAQQQGDNDILSSILGGLTGALGATKGTGGGGALGGNVAYNPGVTSPLIRVGEPTVPDAWMTGGPLDALPGIQ